MRRTHFMPPSGVKVNEMNWAMVAYWEFGRKALCGRRDWAACSDKWHQVDCRACLAARPTPEASPDKEREG